MKRPFMSLGCIFLESMANLKPSQSTQAKTGHAVLHGFFGDGVVLCTWVCGFFFNKVWVWKGKILWGRGKNTTSRVLGYFAMHSCKNLLPATDNLSHHRNLSIIHFQSPSISKISGSQTREGILWVPIAHDRSQRISEHHTEGTRTDLSKEDKCSSDQSPDSQWVLS